MDPVTPTPRQLSTLAEDVAREAGAMVVERRRAVEKMHVSATKTTPTDVVTQVDIDAETLIRKRLLAERPDDGVIGEEHSDIVGSTGIDWIVDPIDGTVNYLYGIGQYAVSIAARGHDGMLAGAVYNPATEEMWTATRGAGAYVNGRKIQVSDCSELELALVGTGFGYTVDRRTKQAAVVNELLVRVRDIRRLGAASLDLCAVACGRLDAYYELGLRPWDHAAAGLIAAEAGADVRITPLRDPGHDFVSASTPSISSQFHALLTDLGAATAG